MTKSKDPKLASIVSGGLSIMQVSSEFHPGAEDHVSWTVRLLEIEADKYFAAGQLRVEGKNARGSVDVTSNVTLSNELVGGGAGAIKVAFPDSALNHSLYDMAAVALRTVLGLTAADLRVSPVTPETVIDILSHDELQEVRKKTDSE